MMDIQHRDLARGRWLELSLAEQLGHVGSEISRTIRCQHGSTAASLQKYFDAFALAARRS